MPLFTRTDALNRIASTLQVERNGQADEEFASTLHVAVDTHIKVSASNILRLMDLHDAIEEVINTDATTPINVVTDEVGHG